ncbi:MAG: FAD-dependent oxidoreductase [Chloroflexi bacterium]|nr:FAD-dependent oxidoreductase [Chloroflexota bacterium]
MVDTVSQTPTAKVKRLVAPCIRACPAGIDVPRYIGLIEKGRFAEAVAVVREKLPLPSVCSHVCYRPCEPMCRRKSMDAPVLINALKRAATDRDRLVWRARWQATIAAPTGKRVAVVGSGPAGLSAAYYLGKRCGHSVTVLEAAPELGGQLRTGIPAYRLPRHVLDEDIDVVTETRVEVSTSHRVNSLDDLFRQGYDAIVLAVGTCRANKLNIPGEDIPGVMDCLGFLSDVNLGQPVPVGKRVAVVGGGNVAVDGARTALRMGAQEVTIVYRRTRAEMPAYSFEVHAAEEEGVKLHFLAAPRSVEAADGHLRLHLIKMELGEPDASGRRRPVPVPGSDFSMDVDTVLAAIGQAPDHTEAWGVELNKDGTLKVDPTTMLTSREGVFAGGDVVTGPLNFTEAIAAGRRAASAIDRYLGGSGDTSEVLAPLEGDEMEFSQALHPVGVEPLHMKELDPGTRSSSFDEVDLGYTEDEAVHEARRCIRCDLWRLKGVPVVWPRGKKFTD